MNKNDAYTTGVHMAQAYAEMVGIQVAKKALINIRETKEGLDWLLLGFAVEAESWFEYEEDELL